MALKHQLRIAGAWVPKLDAPIFRSTHDPFAIRRHSNAEDKVLKLR